ncbi:MAG: BREX system P-loop protein BrxC, partial [Polaribacter sp.]|nr:BREX system P-loop protein BrxC [Polaribacter sp.]
QEFLEEIKNQLGVEWKTIQNDPLVVDSLVPEFAHKFYPEIFKTTSSFNTESQDFIRFENERVSEMIEIVKEETGKDHILFIIDEVGQYVGSRQNLILNLDGLAKNLKNIGDGKVWIIGTAQQTLMEDDPKAALNSPELYKLKDRFPIQVDLESNDIKEICYRRLLGKSSDGDNALVENFSKYGQELRHNTALKDAKYYDSDFNERTFVHLYPFLPAHFSILLHLLGALAKSTGGIGLRSAIKIVQDILIEKIEGDSPVSDKEIGWLATTVTLFDSLKRDIQRAFPSVYNSVNQACIRFPDSDVHQSVAKTVGVLQILGNIPVNSNNISGLMHPSINSKSQHDDVKKAIEDMSADSHIPFGEQDGNYKFFSEKLNDIEVDRAQLPLRSIELKKIMNEAIKNSFSPSPNTRLNNSLSISSGLKVLNNNHLVSIYGDRDSIQMITELVNQKEYENEKSRIVDESRQRTSQNTIYLIGKESELLNEKIAEIYRCREIVSRNRNEPDSEIKEYCGSQIDRSSALEAQLTRDFKSIFLKGSFVFRGNLSSVDTFGEDLIDCCKSNLSNVAEVVYDRHYEAPNRVETTLAEKFLRVGNLMAVDSKLDPLSIVKITDGVAKVDVDSKCLVSIRDYVERNGTVDGKRILDYFSNPPFGWSQDTARYLIAGLLVASEIKIKLGGREITVNGQNAIDALKTNNTFKNVGISLREERPSNEILARASERLTKIFGDPVVPLEDEISKSVLKHMPNIQQWLGPLGEKLKNLKIQG